MQPHKEMDPNVSLGQMTISAQKTEAVWTEDGGQRVSSSPRPNKGLTKGWGGGQRGPELSPWSVSEGRGCKGKDNYKIFTNIYLLLKSPKISTLNVSECLYYVY